MLRLLVFTEGHPFGLAGDGAHVCAGARRMLKEKGYENWAHLDTAQCEIYYCDTVEEARLVGIRWHSDVLHYSIRTCAVFHIYSSYHGDI